jgi:hypothetical protein
MLLITGHTEKVDCWLSTKSEGVKKVSCWDWFDFKQIKENVSLKDIYLSAKKTLSRNKDNASLEQYTPTIKETLTLLDKQHSAIHKNMR